MPRVSASKKYKAPEPLHGRRSLAFGDCASFDICYRVHGCAHFFERLGSDCSITNRHSFSSDYQPAFTTVWITVSAASGVLLPLLSNTSLRTSPGLV